MISKDYLSAPPMSKKSLCIVCALALSVVDVYCKGGEAHDFNNPECTLCHPASSSTMADESYAGLTAKCMTCHTTLYDKGYLHPVDITPQKVRIPLDFPLSPSGTLTCATCHDVHADQEKPVGKRSFFLRRYEKGKAFCDICHLGTYSLASGHETPCRAAHLEAKYPESDYFTK